MTRSIKIIVPDDYDARPLGERTRLRELATQEVAHRLGLWSVRLRPDERVVIRLEPDPSAATLNVRTKAHEELS